MATIPVWDGLWSPGYNSMPSIFLEGGSMAVAMSPGGTVKEGVLTPAYEAQFRARRAEIEQYGEQLYDRLTTCQYPGTARWLWEPYVKEFANTPKQTWMLNDLMNETRRVYINSEHINIDGKHSATGDSIGFWDGNKLIIWTKWINPADYLRGMPLTSNQLEMVESWEEVFTEDGLRQLITQVTFYDPIGLQSPQSAVYVHTSALNWHNLEPVSVIGNAPRAVILTRMKPAERFSICQEILNIKTLEALLIFLIFPDSRLIL